MQRSSYGSSTVNSSSQMLFFSTFDARKGDTERKEDEIYISTEKLFSFLVENQ